MTYYARIDRRKNGIEGIDFVTCKVCKIKKDVLKRHIKVHNITWQQYLNLFPSSKPTSEVYGKIMSEVRTGSKNGMFGAHRFGEENPFFGKKHKKESLEQIGSNRRGKYIKEEHWLYQKGYLIKGILNPNYGPNENLKGEKNPFFGKTHTDETKEKLRSHPNIITKGFLGHKHTITNRDKASKRMMEMHLTSLWSITGKNHGVFFHSSYECMFLEICKRFDLKVERANKFRTAYFFKGKRRWYTPDFYISHLNLIVEVKGWETDKDRVKHKQFMKKHFYIDFVQVKKDDLKQLMNLLNISYDIKTFEGVTFYCENKVKKKTVFF